LQAVDPNSEILFVSSELHFGQRIVSSLNKESLPLGWPLIGGAMP
jgi:hypothetical protein